MVNAANFKLKSANLSLTISMLMSKQGGLV